MTGTRSLTNLLFGSLFGRHSSRHVPAKRFVRLVFNLEQLEERALLDASSTLVDPLGVMFTPNLVALNRSDSMTPMASTGSPTGTTPDQIRTAYGFYNIVLPSGTALSKTLSTITNPSTGKKLTMFDANAGKGMTIAIVDAYDEPNIIGDANVFSDTFNLPRFNNGGPTLTRINQTGGTTLPKGNASWGEEIALDVEWAHAMAPQANIVLVEASSSYGTDMYKAVDTASTYSGVSVVSMSWGGGESASDLSSNSHFTTPKVTYVASSGDYGAPTSYPSSSPNVLSVGGTTLKLNTSTNTITSETGWSGSGGGISAYEAQPSYQSGIVPASMSTVSGKLMRANPDVAYDSDPYTGFPVYDTYGTNPYWAQYGGTSDAAPQWAALIAIANQGRKESNKSSLSGSETLSKIYAMPLADFNDTNSGTSTGSPSYTAVDRYDLVTGRGTPVANLVVRDLSNDAAPASRTLTSIDVAPATAMVPINFKQQFTATAYDQYGVALAIQPTFSWSISSTQTPAGGIGSIDSNGLYTAPSTGTPTVTITATSGSIKKSATVTVVSSNIMEFKSTDLGPIQGGYSSVSNLVIGQDVTIADLNVVLNITYPRDSDLKIHLVSPSGVDTVLSNFRGGTGANFGTSTVSTTFDSEATKAISSGSSAPFAGSYRPEGTLASFNNKNAKGTWKLYVDDYGSFFRSGSINSWSLVITASPATTSIPATTTSRHALAQTVTDSPASLFASRPSSSILAAFQEADFWTTLGGIGSHGAAPLFPVTPSFGAVPASVSDAANGQKAFSTTHSGLTGSTPSLDDDFWTQVFQTGKDDPFRTKHS